MSTALFDSAWGPVAVALTVGCVVFVAAMVAFARPRGAWLRSRIDPSGRLGTSVGVTVDASPGWRLPTRRLFGYTERALERTRPWRATMRLLERAGSQLRPVVFVYQSLLLGLGAAVLAAIVLGSLGLSLLVLASASALPWLRTRYRAYRRLRAFEDQLADMLMTISGSLRVGFTFNQSIAAIVRDGRPPVSEEFERLLNETQLGRPLEDALAAMGDRIASDDLRFVLMSVGIQREVGGSLADLFQTVSETVRERQQFRRKVRALTATGRMSAYILVALPFMIGGIITLLNPGYMAPMYESTLGWVLIAVMAVMMAMGALFLKRIVTIKG